ncbi:MAG: sialidase family protein [Geminicoccaceae bacterium]
MHAVLLKDEHAYLAHAHLARVGSDLLTVFNCAPRRAFVLHPPEDPLFRNYLIRSSDEGATWSAPVVVPDFAWSGVECAGLTDLGGGRAMLNQWRFDWYPLPAARKRDPRGLVFPDRLAAAHLASKEHETSALATVPAERLMPWARGGGSTWIHLSDDGGQTWPVSMEIDTGSFSGGYGMRGGVVLPDRTILLPLSDVPYYESVFVVRSTDGGLTWSAPITAAAVPGRLFEEPAPLLLPDGRVLLHLRDNISRTLWQTHSSDGGLTWSTPEPTGIDGYPGHLCPLPDGTILCTYGFRREPFSIRAVLSHDGGRRWTAADPIIIRDDLPSLDLGYPCTARLADGDLLTAYYARGRDGITCLQTTRWSL